MKLTIETQLEDDGCWIAEVIELPGVITYGKNREEAVIKVQSLALRILAEKLEHQEITEQLQSLLFTSKTVFQSLYQIDNTPQESEKIMTNAWGKPVTLNSINQAIKGLQELRQEIRFDQESIFEIIREGRRF